MLSLTTGSVALVRPWLTVGTTVCVFNAKRPSKPDFECLIIIKLFHVLNFTSFLKDY